MNKLTKICLIAGGTCVLTGGGIAAVAVAMGGSLWNVFPMRNLDTVRKLPESFKEEIGEDFEDAWEDFDFDFDYGHHMENADGNFQWARDFPISEIRSLEAGTRGGSILVSRGGETDRITVAANGDESLWDCYAEDGELKISVYSEQDSHDESQELVLVIRVPADYVFDSVELKTESRKKHSVLEGPKTGCIEAEGVRAGEMELDAKTGAIKVNDGVIGTLDASCEAGALEFSGSVSGNIEGDCQVGAIQLNLTGPQESYNYEIECSLGSVAVGTDSYAGLSGKKTVNNNAQKKMELKCSTGAVEVSFDNEL